MAALAMSGAARADLYAASAALEAKDYARAFELFRELAELGHAESQEMIAAMYVNGEGVKRDNVLGYAWAALALENGGGEAARGIVAQLEPHLNATARARIAEVQAQFGKAALQARLLPTAAGTPALPSASTCTMKASANPDTFFPPEAWRRGISGSVLVEVAVAPDGRARNARVRYSLPGGVFEEAGRRVALSNVYTPALVDGVATPCTIRFKVRFLVKGGGGADAELKRTLEEFKEKARAGDPKSQLIYGLLLEMRADLNDEKENSLDWFVKAAQGGVASAQYLIGMHTLSAVGQGAAKDDSKGLIWLRKAVDAGQSDAQTALANYLLRTGKDPAAFGEAQDLLEKAAATGNRDGKFYLAAVLATGPDAVRRNPARTLDLLEQVKGDLDFDPTFFEVRAAAKAQLGDFQGAQKDQKVALLKARNFGWDLKDQNARLAVYEQSKPWTGNLFAY
jgi:TonB family protein